MSALVALILGIVEGLTEFLPISSTAHLLLASSLLGLPETEFWKSFAIVIQVGAIAAVVVLYWQSFLQHPRILARVLVAFLPTAIIGLLLYKVVKTYFLGSIPLVLWSLFLGGIVIVAFEYWHKEKASAARSLETITYKQAVWIGIFQSLSIIPGVSRAAATIIGGELVGISRRTIVDFSFLLAVPTMAAASALDLLKSGRQFSGGQFGLMGIGLVTSFIIAILSIRWFLGYVKNHSFTAFGIYRILLALAFWVL